MAKSSLSILPRFVLEFSAAVLVFAFAYTSPATADETIAANIVSGPALVEVEPGKVWIDIPAGYKYVVNPADVKREDEAAGRPYVPTHLATIAADNGVDILVRACTTPIDDGDWSEVLSPGWKQRQMDQTAAVSTPLKADGTPAGLPFYKLLGWAAEPTYTPGPPRRQRMPYLIENKYGVSVMMISRVRNEDHQITLLANSTLEEQTVTAKQLETLLASARFEAPVDTSLKALNWSVGPDVQLSLTGVSLHLPPGYLCLTKRDDLAAYGRATSHPASDDQLAIVAPSDLSWTAVLTDTPGDIGDGRNDPLAGQGKDTLLRRFRQQMEPAPETTAANRTTYQVPDFQAAPVYSPGPPQSLFMPFIVLGSDHSQWVALVGVRATPGICVTLTAFVPADQFDRARRTFEAAAESIRISDPRPASAKQVVHAATPNSAGPQADDWTKYGASLAKLGGMALVAVGAVLSKTYKNFRAAIREGSGRTFEPQPAASSSSVEGAYDGPLPPPPPTVNE